MWLWDGASFKRTSFGPIDMYGKSTPQPNLTQCIFDCKQLKYKVAEDSDLATCSQSSFTLVTRPCYMLPIKLHTSYQTLLHAQVQASHYLPDLAICLQSSFALVTRPCYLLTIELHSSYQTLLYAPNQASH